MPDSTLRVGAEFDVGPLVAGAQQASASFQQLGSVIEQQAVKFAAQGVTAEDNVKILQGLGYTAKEAAAAVAALGGSAAEMAAETEVATVALTGFDRAAAMAGGRILGMEAGLGMAGGAVGRLAAYLPGLGIAFELALPIALIAAFVPEVEKLMKASQDLADAQHAVAEAAQKQNDELLKLDEEYTRITQGPIAAYEKEIRDLPLLSLDLSNETKVLTKELEEESHAWTSLAAEAQHFIIVAAAIGTLGLVGNTKHMTEFAYSAADAEKAIDTINDKVKQNKDVGSALVGINLEIVKAEKYLNDEKEAGRNLDVERTQHAIDALNEEKKYLETEQEITKSKSRNMQAEAAKDLASQTAREIQAEEKLQETISKTAAIQAEAASAASVESGRALPELSLPDIDAKKAAIATALAEERDQQLAAADQLYEIKVTETNKELALYRAGSEEYKKVLDKQRQDTANYDLQVAEINRASSEKIANSNRELEAKYREMMIRQADDAEKAAERMAELQISENKRAQEEITAEEKRQMELRQAELKAAMTGLGSGPLTEALKDQFNDEQLKAYDAELQRLAEQLGKATIEAAGLQAKLAGGGILTPEEIERLRTAEQLIGQLSNAIGQLKVKQVELQAEMVNSWQEIERSMQKALNTGFNTFNQQFLKMIETGQSFGKTMANVWNSMVASFITDVLKMGEQWIATELLKLAVSQSSNQAQTASTLATNAIQRLDDAKTAAAKAMASVGFPLDLIVGPLVFAAALAFEEGGIVPGNRMIYAHDQEMVLPKPISSAIQGAVPAIQNFNNAMQSNPPAAGGRTTNVSHHYRPTININSSGGRMSTDEIAAAVNKGMRQGRIGRSQL
jgi:hypothetical protein